MEKYLEKDAGEGKRVNWAERERGGGEKERERRVRWEAEH